MIGKTDEGECGMDERHDELRTVGIGPMDVAVFHGYGASPEMIAFGKLVRWIKETNAMDRVPKPRVFGFNNPNPSPGSEEYGYDFWIELPPDSGLAERVSKQPETVGDDNQPARLRFEGGLYVALAHEGPGETIPNAWASLVETAARLGYAHGKHQWLEEHFIDLTRDDGVLSLDCLLPVSRALHANTDKGSDPGTQR